MGEGDHLAYGKASVEPCDPTGLDMPLHTRVLRQLSRSERAHYQTALALLSSGGDLLALVQSGDLPLAGLGVYEALLTRSWTIRFQDKEGMVQFTQAAVDVAERLDSKSMGLQEVADLRSRAWGELGNALRASNQLRSANRAFGQAYHFQTRGTGDPYLKARLFDLEASLLGTWRDFSAAEARLQVTADLYMNLGESHLAGRAFISQALYTFYDCRPEEALQLNEQGKKLINPRRDRALFLMAMHNDLLYLVDLGRFPEAKKRLFTSRQHFIYQDRINALRLRGIEGRIEYGLGKAESAEIIFREVKEGLLEFGLSFYLALVSLELAMTLLKQKKFEEAEQEVLGAQDLFKKFEVYREFLGSMVLLEELFKQRKVTPAHIQNAIAEIWRKNLQVGPRHFR